MSKIIYEPHPVSIERREALIEQGFKIIDAKFAPDDYVHPDKPDKKKTPSKKVNSDESNS